MDAYTMVEENMQELMQSNLFSAKTNQRTEGQYMWELYTIYDEKKLLGQDSLQEEIW